MTSKKIILIFPKNKIDKPIVYKLFREHDLIINILKASITPDQEGHMALELEGNDKAVEQGIQYLKSQGIKIEPLSKEIKVDEDKCNQCTACVSICPTGALYIDDRKTMHRAFDPEKCIACELCIRPCPARAIEVHF